MLETDHLQPPRENNGTRKPLDPRRRKGMFLGSNSTLVFGMVNNAWIETRFEKVREKGSAVYLCRGAAAYLRAVDVFPASCATLTELSSRAPRDDKPVNVRRYPSGRSGVPNSDGTFDNT